MSSWKGRFDQSGKTQTVGSRSYRWSVPALCLQQCPYSTEEDYSTTIAASTAEVLCLEKRDVRQLCEEHRELLWNVARVLAEKVRHYAELIETLALRNVNQRVAQYVLTICEERGIPDQGGCIVEITMTRAELASRVGSTREVVSRAFGHLQTNGLIRLKGARLMMIPDLKTLKKFANPEHPLERAKLISELSSEMA